MKCPLCGEPWGDGAWIERQATVSRRVWIDDTGLSGDESILIGDGMSIDYVGEPVLVHNCSAAMSIDEIEGLELGHDWPGEMTIW